MENISQEKQLSLFNSSLEDIQNTSSYLDQVTFPDTYQDYFTTLNCSDYLPRFYPNELFRWVHELQQGLLAPG